MLLVKPFKVLISLYLAPSPSWAAAIAHKLSPAFTVYVRVPLPGIHPDHVGIEVDVTGDTIKVIEGNISDSVGYRNIKVNGKNICGRCSHQ